MNAREVIERLEKLIEFGHRFGGYDDPLDLPQILRLLKAGEALAEVLEDCTCDSTDVARRFNGISRAKEILAAYREAQKGEV